jgi:hypothetical protein
MSFTSRGNSVFIVTRLRGGLSGVRILADSTNFSVVQNLQTGSGALPAFYAVGTGVLSRWRSGWTVKLTAHRHLVPRLRMSGAVPLPPYMPLWLYLSLFFTNTQIVYSTVVTIYTNCVSGNRVDLICVFCVILTGNSTALTGWYIIPLCMCFL